VAETGFESTSGSTSVFSPSASARRLEVDSGSGILASGTVASSSCDGAGSSSEGLGVSFLRRGGAARRGAAGTGMEVGGLLEVKTGSGG
jgi:hypothetical protein